MFTVEIFLTLYELVSATFKLYFNNDIPTWQMKSNTALTNKIHFMISRKDGEYSL